MIAPEGLSLDNATPIQPGEQRTMTITARDALMGIGKTGWSHS